MPVIKIDRTNNLLEGSFPNDGNDIIVELDSADAEFTIELPDLTTWGNRAFIFWNKGSGAHTVTLNTKNGNIIDTIGTISIIVTSGSVVTLQSNGVDKILSL